MLKKFLALGCLVACAAVFTGCDKASSAASKASSAADVAKKEAEEKVGKMKEEVNKAVDMNALETKVNGLTGDAKTSALAKLGELKKMFDEFKATTDLTKLGEMKEKLMKAVDELKKQIGM